jgi:hypothetical protein
VDPDWVRGRLEGQLWRQEAGGGPEGEGEAAGPLLEGWGADPENPVKFPDLVSQDPERVWGGPVEEPGRGEEGVGVWRQPVALT